MPVKIFYKLIFTLLFMWFFDGCKSGSKKNQDVGTSYSSTLKTSGDGAAMVQKVPSDLNQYIPKAGLASSSTHQMSSVSLSLAETSTTTTTKRQQRPTTNAAIEKMQLDCYEQNNSLLTKNMFFYAELQTNGNVLLQHNSTDVSGCDEMQLQLKSLQLSQTYVVYANFYWQSDDGKQTIIFYEGTTAPFKPSDIDIPFLLKKKIGDQNLNVELEKTQKDECITKKYLWTGKRCVDQPAALVFSHSDQSNYGEDAGDANARKRKCLTIGQVEDPSISGRTDNSSKAYQYDCTFNSRQMFVADIYSLDRDAPLDPTIKAEFKLQINSSNSGNKKCLTVKDDGKDSFPYLVFRDCFDNAINDKTDPATVTAGVQRPNSDQLFTITQAKTTDIAGRDTFMIESLSSKFHGKCISLPPIDGDPLQGSPLVNNVRAYMVQCQNPVESIRQTQFFRFQESGD